MNWNTKRSKKANACHYWETIIVMEESITVDRGKTWQINLSFLLLSTSATQFSLHTTAVSDTSSSITHKPSWHLDAFAFCLRCTHNAKDMKCSPYVWMMLIMRADVWGYVLCTGSWVTQVHMSSLINLFLVSVIQRIL